MMDEKKRIEEEERRLAEEERRRIEEEDRKAEEEERKKEEEKARRKEKEKVGFPIFLAVFMLIRIAGQARDRKEGRSPPDEKAKRGESNGRYKKASASGIWSTDRRPPASIWERCAHTEEGGLWQSQEEGTSGERGISCTQLGTGDA